MTDATANTSNAPTQPPLFEARKVCKSFGSVIANQDVSLSVRAGEKHALLGENGAGKSTFVKMIDGVLKPDSGAFFWNGKRVSISSPAAARRRGIGMIFQHFSSFEALTVAENIALALPGRSKRAIRSEIRGISERYGLSIDPSRRVERLSAGEKQRVEIVRALLQKPKLLILDEPTSVLTPQEADGLFETLNSLSAEGMALIYISHRLPEITALCDRATVLRGGKVVGTCDPKTTSVAAMAEMMIGEVSEPIRRQNAFVGGTRLLVDNLSLPVREGVPLRKISFGARRGEILGIAGVAGEGQDTLFAALSGEKRTAKNTAIRFDDKPVGSLGPTARRRLGGAFAPEQRLGHAAISDLQLSENLRLTRHGMPGAGRAALRRKTDAIRETYDVRAAKGDPKAGTLSGGNLQKFVIGRELDRDPSIFVVAQPTWGVDAGAAASIRGELMALAERGAAVVVISQDLDEIFQIADQVAVIHRGSLSETYPIADMTPERIGLLMAGADADALSRAENEAAAARPAPGSQPELVTAHPGPVPAVSGLPAALPAPALTLAQPTVAAPAFQTSMPNLSDEPQMLTQTSLGAPLSPPKPPPAPPRFSMGGTVETQWTPREQFQRFEARS